MIEMFNLSIDVSFETETSLYWTALFVSVFVCGLFTKRSFANNLCGHQLRFIFSFIEFEQFDKYCTVYHIIFILEPVYHLFS